MSDGPDLDHWASYNNAQQDRDVRPLCLRVLDLADVQLGRRALDFGCGLGRESAEMLDRGWRVHGIDCDPSAEVWLGPDARPGSRFTLQVAEFENLVHVETVDLIYAGYALPYVAADEFARVWQLLRASLAPGGWIAVDLFGVNDSWNGERDFVFVSSAQVREMFRGLEIVEFDEEEASGLSFTGRKHWHTFEVIARCP